jgi:regulator of nonsense transcripts 2
LDYFLIFFQHYYWFKKSDEMFTQTTANDAFPILTDNMYKECISNIRPKLKLFKSYDVAQEAVEKLQKQLYPDLMKMMEAENTPGDDSLKTIREENGDDESEHGETVTEDNTSEAIYESDDDGKPRNKREDDDDDDDDNVDDMREVELLPTRHSHAVKLIFSLSDITD